MYDNPYVDQIKAAWFLYGNISGAIITIILYYIIF